MSTRRKILYAASTASHLRRFHMPYIEALRCKYDVFLMATEGEGIDFPISFSKSFFSPSNLRSVFRIRKILKRERFDKIIVHTTLAAFLIRAAMLGMKKRPYVLNVVHGYLFSRPIAGKKDRLLLLCERLMRNMTDALAVMNEEDLGIATEFPLCRGSITIMQGMGLAIPEETPKRDEALRMQYAPGADDFLCTFVGELSARKNQMFLIRAAERLRGEGIPIRLLLLGDGSQKDLLEQEIRDTRLEDCVFLAGNREPILPYLGISDLYVSASISEGLPFNVMEAMSVGLPILASDTKGQNDLLRAYSDTLYPLQDMDAFCEKLKRVYTSGCHGAGSRSYPNLEQYRLGAVFDENMKLFSEGGHDENQA